MQRRKRTFERPTWEEQIEAMKAELLNAPSAKEREDLNRKIGQLEAASHMMDWLTSPGLRSPT